MRILITLLLLSFAAFAVDVKISELPTLTTATGSAQIPIVQVGTTQKITVTNLFTSRAIAGGTATGMQLAGTTANVGTITNGTASGLTLSGGTATSIRLSGATVNAGTISGGSASLTLANGTAGFTVPSANGTSGQVLTFNGAGATSWTTVSGGTGSATTTLPISAISGIGAGGTAALAIATGSAGAFIVNGGTAGTIILAPTTFYGAIASRGNGVIGGGMSIFNAANSSEGFLTVGTMTDAHTWYLPDADTKLPISAHHLTFVGHTAARDITIPNSNFTVARTDAAQTFTGAQTFGTTGGGAVVTGSSGILYVGGVAVGTGGGAGTPGGSSGQVQYNNAGAFAGASNLTVTGGTLGAITITNPTISTPGISGGTINGTTLSGTMPNLGIISAGTADGMTFTGQQNFPLSTTTGTGSSSGFVLSADSLTSGTGVYISSISTGSASGTQKLMNISKSGLQIGAGTSTAVSISNTSTGTAAGMINKALVLAASGATGTSAANYALDITAGSIRLPSGTMISQASGTGNINFNTNTVDLAGGNWIFATTLGYGFMNWTYANGSSIGFNAAGTYSSTADLLIGRGTANVLQVGVTAAAPAANAVVGAKATGAHIYGGNLIISGGVATGTATGGALIFKTTEGFASTGSTSQQGYMTRQFHSAKPVIVSTGTAATTFATLGVGTGKYAGGIIGATLVADGTGGSIQSQSSHVYFDAINATGTASASISQVDNTAAVSAGTLTVAYSTVVTGTSIALQVLPTTSLGTSARIKWSVLSLQSDQTETSAIAGSIITPQ